MLKSQKQNQPTKFWHKSFWCMHACMYHGQRFQSRIQNLTKLPTTLKRHRLLFLQVANFLLLVSIFAWIFIHKQPPNSSLMKSNHYHHHHHHHHHPWPTRNLKSDSFFLSFFQSSLLLAGCCCSRRFEYKKKFHHHLKKKICLAIHPTFPFFFCLLLTHSTQNPT